MTVLARTKSGVGRIRRYRAGHVPERPATTGVPAEGPAPDEADPPAPAGADPAERRLRREAGLCEDEAVYACQCGFVFHAVVSTSVDCPHCGSSQAW